MDSSPDLSIKLPKGESPEDTYMDFSKSIKSDIENVTAEQSQLVVEPVQIDPPSPILPPPSLDSVSTDESEKVAPVVSSNIRDSLEEDLIMSLSRDSSVIKPDDDDEEEDEDEEHSIILNQTPIKITKDTNQPSDLDDLLKSLDRDNNRDSVLTSQKSKEDDPVRSLSESISASLNEPPLGNVEELPAPPEFLPPAEETYDDSSLKFEPLDLSDVVELEKIAPPSDNFYSSTQDELVLNLEERHVSFDKDEEMLLNQLKQQYDEEEENDELKPLTPPSKLKDLNFLETSLLDEVKMIQDELLHKDDFPCSDDNERELSLKLDEPPEQISISPPKMEDMEIIEPEPSFTKEEELPEIIPKSPEIIIQSPESSRTEELKSNLDRLSDYKIEKELDFMKDEESDQEVEKIITHVDEKSTDSPPIPEEVDEKSEEPQTSISPAVQSPITIEAKPIEIEIRQKSPEVEEIIDISPRIVDTVPKQEEYFRPILDKPVELPKVEIEEKIEFKPIEKIPEPIKEIPKPIAETKEPIQANVEKRKSIEQKSPPPPEKEPEKEPEKPPQKVDIVESKIISPKMGRSDDSKKTYVPAYTSYVSKQPYSSGIFTQPPTTIINEPYNMVMRNQMLIQDEKRQRTSNTSQKSSHLREQFLFNNSSQPITSHSTSSQNAPQQNEKVSTQKPNTQQSSQDRPKSRQQEQPQQQQVTRQQEVPSSTRPTAPVNEQPPHSKPENLPLKPKSETNVGASPSDNKGEKRDLPDISTVVKLTDDFDDSPCAQVIQAGDQCSSALSLIYCILIVGVGLSIPLVEVIAPHHIPVIFYQGFYLYLYGLGVLFMLLVYTTIVCCGSWIAPGIISKSASMKKKNDIEENNEAEDSKLKEEPSNQELTNINASSTANIVASSPTAKFSYALPKSPELYKYGSCYLRIGAIVFAIGAILYSALEFLQYFECMHIILVLTPGLRAIFILIQLFFIFLSHGIISSYRCHVLLRLTLMHLIGTDLAMWISILIHETNNIISLFGKVENITVWTSESAILSQNNSTTGWSFEWFETRVNCPRKNILGWITQVAMPYLFPFSIQYALICVLILYFMWRNVGRQNGIPSGLYREQLSSSCSSEKVNCRQCYRGLILGILLLVATIVSLAAYFIFIANPEFEYLAFAQLTVCELSLYLICLLATLFGIIRIRQMHFDGQRKFVLDEYLLIGAQVGIFLYSALAILGTEFVLDMDTVFTWVTAIVSIVQTVIQTIYILDGGRRSANSLNQSREKPGREFVIFLLIVNLALFFLGVAQKSIPKHNPVPMKFFGLWIWTVITHLWNPVATFYRFQSVICLADISRRAYQIKPTFM